MLSLRRSVGKNPSLVVVCILSLALGFSLAANLYHHSGNAAIAAPSKELAASNWRTVFEDISEKLAPCVVFITSEKDVTMQMNPFGGGGGFGDDLFGWPFGPPQRRGQQQPKKDVQKATGTGFIVRSDGYLLTNNH